MKLTVKIKIRIASALSGLVRAGYGLFGNKGLVSCHRRGKSWELDLSEGIDFAIWLLGAYEPEVVKGYSKLIPNGGVVLDIGANIGAHTLHFADIVGDSGKVYAIEPTQYGVKKLKTNLALNPELEKRVEVLQALVTETLDVEPPESICASWPLGSQEAELSESCGIEKTIAGSRVVTLESLIESHSIQRLDFIKLDVDGHETDVLWGGRSVIEKFKPAFIVELAPFIPQESGRSFAEMVEFFTSLGYRFENPRTGRKLPAKADAIEALIPVGAGMNVLAIHNSR